MAGKHKHIHDSKERPSKHPIPKVPPEGFRKIRETCHGQAIYTDGKRYVTPDVDQHNGGWWKMAASPKRLMSKSTRKGTFDENLNPIGD